jgi:hypothetical protein
MIIRVRSEKAYCPLFHLKRHSDWIYASRRGGRGNSHIDIVLDIYVTQKDEQFFNWALAAGGNIAIDNRGSGRTAGFRAYSLDVNFKITSNHPAIYRPDFFSHSDSTDPDNVIFLSQITSWYGLRSNMRGLIRLT